MTAAEVYKGLYYVVIKNNRHTVAAFTEEEEAENYAETKSRDGAAYHIEQVTTQREEE